MYFILFLLAGVILLYLYYCNTEKFANTRSNSKVRRLELEKFQNNTNTTNNTKSCNKSNKYSDEIYQCEGGPFKIQHPEYRSKYDATLCIPCENPPKCNQSNYNCIDENTFYYILDNCTQDGNCRLGEDHINLSPVKDMCN